MSIVYWMCGLNPNLDRYLWSQLLIILTVQACISFGHFLSAVSPSVSLASELAGPAVGPLMIFAGHFLNTDSIPTYFLWLKYLSWLSYSNEAFLINQWHDVEGITCNQDSPRCFTSGKNVLDNLNIDPSNLSYVSSMLVFLSIGWRMMTFVVLLIKSYNSWAILMHVQNKKLVTVEKAFNVLHSRIVYFALELNWVIYLLV